MAGTLYVVATPIGNLEDISYRAVRILRECDLIACEDTRQTRKLLGHYGIDRPAVSYHEHNEQARAAELVAELAAGRTVALVTDAGTPLVSDPGYRVVRAAIDAGIAVVALPGASALMTALAASGLATDAFHFAGFPPAKEGQRRKLFERLAGLQATLVFYEAPHRIVAALGDLIAVMGDRQAVIARELTKLHEEILRGRLTELREQLAARPSIKGEITLLLDRHGEAQAPPPVSLAGQVRECEAGGLARMDAIKEVARRNGVGKREVYRAVESAGE